MRFLRLKQVAFAQRHTVRGDVAWLPLRSGEYNFETMLLPTLWYAYQPLGL